MARATRRQRSARHARKRMSRSRTEHLLIEGLPSRKGRLTPVEPTRDDVEANAHGSPRHARRPIGTCKVQYRYASGLRLRDLIQAGHVGISIRSLGIRYQPSAQSRLERTCLRFLHLRLFLHVWLQTYKSQRRAQYDAYVPHITCFVAELRT